MSDEPLDSFAACQQQEAAAVMPFAKEAITPDQRAALSRRMAARRAVA